MLEFSGALHIVFHADPGHGWYQVPRGVVVALGIADKVSRFSFQHRDQVYLEEDCDAALFFNAARAQGLDDGRIEVVPRDYRGEAPLRRYERFTFDPNLGV